MGTAASIRQHRLAPGMKPSCRRSVSIAQAAERLRERAATVSACVDDLEEAPGGSEAAFLAASCAEAAEEPILFLQDRAQSLHVGLHCLLSDRDP